MAADARTANDAATTKNSSHEQAPDEAQREEEESSQQKQKTKTVAELDDDLRRKMSGIAGDGGAAGVEYEDGKPVAMKRSVRNNMFRYI